VATNIEKENLEAHVEICALRYAQLETRLTSIEEKVEKLEEHVIFIREKLSDSPNKSNKTIIAIGTTIVGVLITAVITLLVKLTTE
jgi:hypothetical protein